MFGRTRFIAQQSLLLALMCLAPNIVAAQPAPRNGFTAEAELGGAKTTFESIPPSMMLETHNGYALRLGLGWFVRPDLAIGVRASRDNVGALGSTFAGGSIQFWWGERVWLGAAAGIQSVAPDDGDVPADDVGAGVMLRWGLTLPSYWSERHLWNVSVEMLIIDPLSHDRGALSAAFLVGYQFL
jgi:hypothetical protein